MTVNLQCARTFQNSRTPGTKPWVQANMHGDEPTGRQLTLALAEWLCGSHGSDPRAARLLGDALLYLLPTMNPDGFAAHRRENRQAVRTS